MGTYQAGSAASFDMASIQRSIDAAMSSIKPEKRGNVLIELNKDGVRAGLVVRGPKLGPIETAGLATFMKPKAGPSSWSVSLGAQFGILQVPDAVDRKVREIIGWWIVLAPYNSPKKALWKALKLSFGRNVPIEG